MRMLRILFWTLVFVGAAALADEKAKEFKPTEVQALRLQVRQDAAVIAQKDLQEAQQKFQGALNELNAEAERIKTANNWPKDLNFDSGTLTFSEPVKGEAKK